MIIILTQLCLGVRNLDTHFTQGQERGVFGTNNRSNCGDDFRTNTPQPFEQRYYTPTQEQRGMMRQTSFELVDGIIIFCNVLSEHNNYPLSMSNEHRREAFLPRRGMKFYDANTMSTPKQFSFYLEFPISNEMYTPHPHQFRRGIVLS